MLTNEQEDQARLRIIQRLASLGFDNEMIILLVGEPVPSTDLIPGLVVSYTDTHVILQSNINRVVQISGDVRDSKALKLHSGKAKKRKLTNEGFQSVIIDGVPYPY